MNNSFFAGAAREITTPKIGTLLYGYRPDLVSKAVHDDLSVTALAVSQSGNTALLITAEVGDIQTALCDETREKCEKLIKNSKFIFIDKNDFPKIMGQF